MKVLIFALALTCVAAVPASDVNVKNERIVDLFITNYINELSERVGRLDPHDRALYAGAWSPPGAEEILALSGYAVNVRAAQFSKFFVSRIAYNLFSGELDFALRLEDVSGSVGRAVGEAKLFSTVFTAEGRGDLSLGGIEIAITAVVGLGADGVAISDVNAVVSIDRTSADFDLDIHGREVGSYLTSFFNNLPRYTVEYKEEITAVVNYVVTWYINRRD